MWFTANLSIKGIDGPNGSTDPLWMESIRLIEAASEDDALAKAQQIGSAQEHSYRTQGGSITWVFDRAERIFPLEGNVFSSGTELFNRFLRDSEATSLLTPFEDEP